MSKYDALWKSFQTDSRPEIVMSFDEIEKNGGVPIDHSFLNYKKELLQYGYEVKKISLRDKTVAFIKIKGV